MTVCRVSIPPHVTNVLTHLPPAVKRDAKQAVRILSQDPYAGEPLERELHGLWKYRIRTFRIVYRIVTEERLIQVMAVGPRDTIYEVVRAAVRQRKQVPA
ncbi:MAG: type II toxin-antitoxin system RelE/ParE family toxin [Candidatus Omnitrophica bacterium]|nr:type II toxin-antitoxin system RelE/ParE family toxin [Candidatus Omnitrophota bacterium]